MLYQYHSQVIDEKPIKLKIKIWKYNDRSTNRDRKFQKVIGRTKTGKVKEEEKLKY